MNKSQYFEELKDIITDPIYQAQTTSDIKQEIAKNMWCISMPSELTEEVNSEDYIWNFLVR
ncbi:hypothetical protein H1230_06910 [Paenibacillus sp. 19GGS1-52]|uniref:hypothetical protein n=1 Tax=Paenibacillus sp. 19GGS1-52 TaxID=2758563 RepID=UPI001EFB2C00|nr:hypothetical protein [Paenibacillus sp. 19GGS1-52]ULO08531.1 hypothetical protein H1230_06910 [Paenibacillus sp. 19GGS1-52]